MCEFKYIKHNKARFKIGKREEGTKILADFFKSIQKSNKGIKGIYNNE